MRIGFWELIVILIVALLVIGPDKLPETMRELGKGLRAMQNAAGKLSDSISLDDDDVQPKKETMAKKDTWICPKCGERNTGHFCANCGTAKPVADVKEEAL